MKLLVTGGCGFIGANFIRFILERDSSARVTNLDKQTYAGAYKGVEDIAGKRFRGRYTFVKGDICSSQLIDALTKRVDCVINFAAETHVDRSIIDARPFVRTNVEGVHNLLANARKNRVKRFIQISTDEVYGSCDRESFHEGSRLAPNNPYSATKAAADLLVRSFTKTYDLPAIVVRISNNFGPYQFPEKVIPLFITNALLDRKLPLYGDGKHVRDWLYVKDTCEALSLILNKGLPREIYNIAGKNEMRNSDLAGRIVSMLGLGTDRVSYIKDRPGHDRRYSLDIAKIKRELGWAPSGDFDAKLRETIRWYCDNSPWWLKIRKSRKSFGDYYNKQYARHS